MKAEDKALVLDFLPRGRSSDYKTEPMAQIIGREYFTLLEVTPKSGITLKALDEVYVGKDAREHVEMIRRRITYGELTSTAQSELKNAIDKIVLENEKRFVDFYNTSRSITLKRHQIELLPGMGKKHMLAIISERERGVFETFASMRERVHGMPDPVHAIVGRIIEELEGSEDKYFLFARPPSQEKDFRQRSRSFGQRRFSDHGGANREQQ